MTAESNRVGQLLIWARNSQNTKRTRKLAEEELFRKYGIKLLKDRDYSCGMSSLRPQQYKEW